MKTRSGRKVAPVDADENMDTNSDVTPARRTVSVQPGAPQTKKGRAKRMRPRALADSFSPAKNPPAPSILDDPTVCKSCLLKNDKCACGWTAPSCIWCGYCRTYSADGDLLRDCKCKENAEKKKKKREESRPKKCDTCGNNQMGCRCAEVCMIHSCTRGECFLRHCFYCSEAVAVCRCARDAAKAEEEAKAKEELEQKKRAGLCVLDTDPNCLCPECAETAVTYKASDLPGDNALTKALKKAALESKSKKPDTSSSSNSGLGKVLKEAIGKAFEKKAALESKSEKPDTSSSNSGLGKGTKRKERDDETKDEDQEPKPSKKARIRPRSKQDKKADLFEPGPLAEDYFEPCTTDIFEPEPKPEPVTYERIEKEMKDLLKNVTSHETARDQQWTLPCMMSRLANRLLVDVSEIQSYKSIIKDDLVNHMRSLPIGEQQQEPPAKYETENNLAVIREFLPFFDNQYGYPADLAKLEAELGADSKSSLSTWGIAWRRRGQPHSELPAKYHDSVQRYQYLPRLLVNAITGNINNLALWDPRALHEVLVFARAFSESPKSLSDYQVLHDNIVNLAIVFRAVVAGAHDVQLNQGTEAHPIRQRDMDRYIGDPFLAI